jgi:hypothetical protein
LQGTTGYVIEEELMKQLKIGSRDDLRADFASKDGLDFDYGKARDEKLRLGIVENGFDLRRADFVVIAFAPRTGIEEIIGHLAVFSLGNEIRRQ